MCERRPLGAANLDAMPSDVAYHALNVYARSVAWACHRQDVIRPHE
jgi:hypothetical protein